MAKKGVNKMILHNRATGEDFCINGLKQSIHEPSYEFLRQDFTEHILYTDKQLPPKVDLRPWMTPVEHQRGLNTCTANAFAGAYEYLVKKSTKEHIDVSRLFIYYNARKRDNRKENVSSVIEDVGSSITSAIESLYKKGVCLEKIWPYEKNRVNAKPSERSFEKAKKYKIVEALKLDVDFNEMRSCLAQGLPFVFGLKLFKSIDRAAKNGGVVPMPNRTEAARATHGDHAMLAVGYSDKSKAFIVRNSWGEKWGDNGYCYVPYAYMCDKHMCHDLWTIKTLAGNSLGQEQWIRDDTTDYSVPKYNPGSEYDDDNVFIEEVPVHFTFESQSSYTDERHYYSTEDGQANEHCSSHSMNDAYQSNISHGGNRAYGDNDDDDDDDGPNQSYAQQAYSDPYNQEYGASYDPQDHYASYNQQAYDEPYGDGD